MCVAYFFHHGGNAIAGEGEKRDEGKEKEGGGGVYS
jgi:hypothetical protein